MSEKEQKLVSKEEMKEAMSYVSDHPLCTRTPLLCQVDKMFPVLAKQNLQLFLKLENMQTTGSFKIRGVVNQMRHLLSDDDKRIPITMSAGNYGRSFGTYLQSQGKTGLCIMSATAPPSRKTFIENLGISVQLKPIPEIQLTVDRYVDAGTHVYFHPFDDIHLIAGHASVGLEILEDLPNPDIILVCCGGGGLVAGLAAAVKSFGPKECRIYAVEPEGARCMHESFLTGKAASVTVKTIATGLGPPFAGKLSYRHCVEFVEDVLLVSDEEIKQSMELLYNRGLVVEPSGAAAMAALVQNKVPDVDGKKVVVIITGGNYTPAEMSQQLSKS